MKLILVLELLTRIAAILKLNRKTQRLIRDCLFENSKEYRTLMSDKITLKK
jgi:hypothetical protein